MRYKLLQTSCLLLLSIFLLLGCTPQSQSAWPADTNIAAANDIKQDTKDDMIAINITINNSVFTAKLYNNETTQALITQLPLTIQMDDINLQEKKYNLPQNLPSAVSERPNVIYNGDIMSWSGNVLVLFYKTFNNTYGGYVPLGKVDNPSALANALRPGAVMVTWSLDR